MPRMGLSKERVVAAAAELIGQRGTAGFSMHALADSLHVRTSSLYNHVESMDALLSQVCAYALRRQRDMELRAIEGKDTDEAICALADAYRRFARENRQLYRLIMSAASGVEQPDAAECIVEPFLAVLSRTALTKEEKCHWQRVLRGIVHGFVSQEEAGFFAHLPADGDKSFQIAIRCYIDGLRQAERRGQHDAQHG